MFDTTGNYRLVMLILAIAFVISGLAALFVSPVRDKEEFTRV